MASYQPPVAPYNSNSYMVFQASVPNTASCLGHIIVTSESNLFLVTPIAHATPQQHATPILQSTNSFTNPVFFGDKRSNDPPHPFQIPSQSTGTISTQSNTFRVALPPKPKIATQPNPAPPRSTHHDADHLNNGQAVGYSETALRRRALTIPQDNAFATTSVPNRNVTPKPHQCTNCNKTFKLETNLRVHQRVHSEYALKCPVCSKKFARNSNLNQHMRIHTGERPYKCMYCPKAFKQRHSLSDHHRLHRKEKPYSCRYCDKSFAARCNLIVHTRTHTGEKPYECKPCNKQYASKSGWNAHHKKYHSSTAS